MTQLSPLLRYTVHLLSAILRLDRTLIWWSGPVLAVLTLRIIIISALWMPHGPTIAGDAQSYLTFFENRPYGYPMFLKIYGLIFPNLIFLPLAQAVMYYFSAALMAFAISYREQSFICGVATFLLIVKPPFLDLVSVMSDTFYTTFLMLGFSFYVFFLRSERLLVLLCTSIFIGIAAITRTIGYAPMMILLISVGLHSWSKHWARLLPELSATIIPLMACLLIAATGNYLKNGDFRIASWSGVSLLGKGLMVAEPVPLGDPLHEFNWIPEKTRAAKASLDNIDDPMLKMLVQTQYYEYLRWFWLWNELDRHGQPFLTESGKTQNEIANKLARAYVTHSPWAYISLMFYDYLSLWVVPRIITSSEARALQFKFDNARVAYLPEFYQSLETGRGLCFRLNNPCVSPNAPISEAWYFAVVPEPSPNLVVARIRIMNAAFLILSIGLILKILRRHSFIPRVEVSDIVFLFGTVHFSYVATALVEAGLDRYVGATWPMLSAALTIVSIRIVRDSLGLLAWNELANPYQAG